MCHWETELSGKVTLDTLLQKKKGNGGLQLISLATEILTRNSPYPPQWLMDMSIKNVVIILYLQVRVIKPQH